MRRACKRRVVPPHLWIARLAPIVAEVCFSVKKVVFSMVRKVILFLAGVLSLVLIAVEWPIVVPVVHILLGH